MLVPEKEVKAAMAMDSVSYNLGRALAPVLSVAVIIVIGFGWAFEINAISFIVFAAVLLRMPGRPGELAQERSPCSADSRSHGAGPGSSSCC